MDKAKNENTKAINQAWRKKPRKFAPKSRLGCKTCKIRRIKCDLSQPSCLKCQSTGRLCDGYDVIPPTFKVEIAPSHYHIKKDDGAESSDDCQPRTIVNAYQLNQWHRTCPGLTTHCLKPLMVLQTARPAQAEAMWFFEYTSIRHLNGYYPSKLWRDSLMYFSQTVPAVRYAAIALASIHRQHLDYSSGRRMHELQSMKDWLPDEAPFLYYNRAIQLLLNSERGDSTETTAITLLVCYLFTCFDHLACNYVQAMKHLRGGVELLRGMDKALQSSNDTQENADPSEAHSLINQVARQIRRLDMQAATFLVDWTPADTQEMLVPHFPSFNNAFQSLDQAADHLQPLVAQVVRLRNTEQQLSPEGEMPAPPPSFKATVLRQLETWSSLFQNFLLHQNKSSSYNETDNETQTLVSLLRLQYTASWILLNSHGPSKEMGFDDFLPQFQQCIDLARKVTAAHERNSGSLKPSFTPDIGIVPVLYIIGTKCRDPVIRREALRILRRRSIGEAVWDSMSTARVVERVIEIEEAGWSEEGGVVRGMEDIAVWQRVEATSWLHVVSGESAGRLDVMYTFCERDGMYKESLVV